MQGPRISIIIPAHNAAATLRAACASVSRQSVSFKWECLIVNDGSTDSTASLAAAISDDDSRFRYIRQDKQGVSAARNTGIQAACGDLLTFLDADDVWLPDALAALVAPFGDDSVDFVWGGAERFTSNGVIKPVVWKDYCSTGNTYFDLLIHDFLPIGCFCLRRRALPLPPYFIPGLTHGEDRDFLLRVLKHAKAVAIDRSVLFVRLHAGSASTNAAKAIESETYSMLPHIDDPSLPSRIRRRAWSALAFRCAVIAGFTGRDWKKALAWYLRAIWRDPSNINNYLLIFRKLWMRLFPGAARRIPPIELN